MDFLQDLKLFSVPPLTKAIVVVLLAGLGIINTIIFIGGIGIPGHQEHESWIKASIDLLGPVVNYPPSPWRPVSRCGESRLQHAE